MATIEELRVGATEMNVWQRHRFFVLIACVIIISCCMVAIGLHMYNTSGAAQVDLSRPGYTSVQREASRSDSTDAFPATGELDADAFNEFDAMYTKHAREVIGGDNFDDAPISDDTLQLFADGDDIAR